MKARTWYPLTIVALSILASIVAGPRMPARVAIHYDLAGRPNGYGSKYVLLLLGPLLVIFIGGLMSAIRGLVTMAEPGRHAEALYGRVTNITLTFLLALHLSILARTLGYRFAFERLVPALQGILFIAIAGILPDIPRNAVIGLRTPWTLRSDRVWQRSQVVAARLLIVAGTVSLAASVLPFVAGFVVAIVAVVCVTVAATVYSYIAWKQETESSR
jgi:uncharacterized membrane protein